MSYCKFTHISPEMKNALIQILEQNYPTIQAIVARITALNGSVFLVGGGVRDLLMEIPLKDIDCEVHGISLDDLETILKEFGPVSLVGKSFGVLRAHGLSIDWSVPRTDSAGRKPKVELQSGVSIDDALRRRDLTMNAMAIDLHTFQLYDPFGGQNDIKNKVLATPDVTLFVEDPLRFYRVMQFIGRFQMYPDSQLQTVCTTMNISGVSRERIEAEMEKLFLKSYAPSRGIRWLQDIGRLHEIFPEIAATLAVHQEQSWHPEGNVFEHTMQALDAAARLQYDSDQEKLIVMYAALCHDLGKVTTTEIIDGKIRSLGHAQAGVPLAKSLLKRITNNKELIDAVEKLVKYHLEPGQFVKQQAHVSAYKRLAKKLYPQTHLSTLAKVALADKQGRNPAGHEPLHTPMADIDEFIKIASKAHVQFRPEEPVLLGKDLLDHIAPGPLLGEVLDRIYQIQIDDGIQEKDELKKRALQIYDDLKESSGA